MKNKKGFTLIELLAVIVILAIIALIATPVILNIIEKSKKASFTRSAENVVKAGKTYFMEQLMFNEEDIEINFNCNKDKCISEKTDEQGNPLKLEIEGSIGTGEVSIDNNGNISLELSNHGYCATKEKDEKKITVSKGNCGKIDPKDDTTKSEIRNVSYTKTNNSIKIVVSAKDEESGISYYEYSIDDGATWTEKQTSNIYEYKNLSLGTYKIKVRVYNGAYEYNATIGMTESEGKEVTLEVESCPIPTILSENPEGWAQSKEITIDYGNVEGCTGTYSIDNGTTFVEETTVTTSNKDIILKNTNGIDNYTVSYSLEIDNEKPLDITLSSNSNSTYNQTLNVTITLQDEYSGLQAGSIKYGWSESNTVEPTSYTTVSTSSTTGNSATTITASSTDLTGSYYLWVVPVNYKDKTENTNTQTVISTGTFNFDNEGPTLTIGEVTSTENSINIPITQNSDAYSNPVTTTCKAGLSTSDYNKTGTIENNTCTISGLEASKKYYYIVESKDNLNNEATPITGDITTKEKQTYIKMVYYSPTTGNRCTESEYNTNLNNHINAGNPTVTNLKSGCMKWYAYKDNGDGTINMLLDHNTTARVQYNSEGKNSTQKEVAQALSEDTSSWKVEARLITAQEIRDITGNKTTSVYYFNGNSSSGQAKGSNVYSWLFDNTQTCETYGCNAQDNNKHTLYGSTSTGYTQGYWTSTPYASNSVSVWLVYYIGTLSSGNANGNTYGLRPVITVPKN